MDFFFCCPDSSYVSVDSVDPPLLQSSSSSSPRWYHFQSLSSVIFLVSSLHVSNPPQSLPCTSPWCSVLSVSPWSDHFSHGLFACGRMPIYTHLHLCQFQFVFTWELVIGTVSFPYSNTIPGCTIILWIGPVYCGGRPYPSFCRIGSLTSSSSCSSTFHYSFALMVCPSPVCCTSLAPLASPYAGGWFVECERTPFEKSTTKFLGSFCKLVFH